MVVLPLLMMFYLTNHLLGTLESKWQLKSMTHTWTSWRSFENGSMRTSSPQTPKRVPRRLWLCHTEAPTPSIETLQTSKTFSQFPWSYWQVYRSPSSAGTIGEKFISPVLHMPQLVLPCKRPNPSTIQTLIEDSSWSNAISITSFRQTGTPTNWEHLSWRERYIPCIGL